MRSQEWIIWTDISAFSFILSKQIHISITFLCLSYLFIAYIKARWLCGAENLSSKTTNRKSYQFQPRWLQWSPRKSQCKDWTGDNDGSRIQLHLLLLWPRKWSVDSSTTFLPDLISIYLYSRTLIRTLIIRIGLNLPVNIFLLYFTTSFYCATYSPFVKYIRGFMY